jgi:hypothetical protein
MERSRESPAPGSKKGDISLVDVSKSFRLSVESETHTVNDLRNDGLKIRDGEIASRN